MSRVLSLAMALSFSIPLAALAVSAKTASAGTSGACDWGTEMFKDKVSESCQKDLAGKLKDEQDRVYARRVFKNWQPLKGYEVIAEDGFFQAANAAGDVFQAQWVSFEPAILYVNGQLIVDARKETSVYRKIDKLFEKANIANGDAKTAWLSPLRRVLAEDAAEASNSSTSDHVKDNFFVYSVNYRDTTGKTDTIAGTATSVLSGTDADQGGVLKDTGSHLKESNVLPCVSNSLTWSTSCSASTQTFVCNKDMTALTETTRKLDGKDVTITPVAGSRTQFIVTGYPESDHVIKVNMKGTDSVAPGLTYHVRDRNGRPAYHNNGTPVLGYRTACSGRYVESINDSCKSAWADLVAAKSDLKADYDKYMKDHKLDEASKVSYGRDISCEKVYSDSDKARSCRTYLANRFSLNHRHFDEDHAEYVDCGTDRSCKNGEKVLDSEILAKVKPIDDSAKLDKEIKLRKAYIAAIDADPKKPEDKAGKNFCALVSMDGSSPSKVADLQACNKPYRNASKDVVRAFADIKEGADNALFNKRGDDLRAVLTNRILGMMMMGDCCGDSQCVDGIKKNHNIVLNRPIDVPLPKDKPVQ